MKAKLMCWKRPVAELVSLMPVGAIPVLPNGVVPPVVVVVVGGELVVPGVVLVPVVLLFRKEDGHEKGFLQAA